MDGSEFKGNQSVCEQSGYQESVVSQEAICLQGTSAHGTSTSETTFSLELQVPVYILIKSTREQAKSGDSPYRSSGKTSLRRDMGELRGSQKQSIKEAYICAEAL
jgi:hypothetical protein